MNFSSSSNPHPPREVGASFPGPANKPGRAVSLLLRNRETAAGLLFFGLSLYLFHEISSFSSTAEKYRSLGPEVFPLVLTAMLCLLSVALFIQGLRKEPSRLLSFDLKGRPMVEAGVILGFLFIYLAWIDTLGFVVWGLAYMALGQYVLGQRHWLPMAVLSLATVGTVYFIFATLLHVPLPGGFLAP